MYAPPVSPRPIARSRSAPLLFAAAVAAACPPARAGEAVDRLLAGRLAAEGDYRGAAVEYRRLALDAAAPGDRAGFYWASAFEYLRADDPPAAARMLRETAEALPDATGPLRLLQARTARAAGAAGEEEFHLESALATGLEPAGAAYAARALAAARLRQGRPGAAREALAASPLAYPRGLAAVETYRAGRDRSPRVGGLLGLVPGLGYAYAGEYANGLRSLLLNGIFLFGIWDQADRENWGAVAAISFFEITWYSGSVYGGIDAANRFNRRRLESAEAEVLGGARFEPDPQAYPLVRLRYLF